MKTLFIVFSFLFLVFGGIAKAEEFFLKCGSSNTLVYVNTTKKLVGEAYFQKNKKDLFIYDWVHEGVKISDEEIKYNNTITFLYGYIPTAKYYNKHVINRNSGRKIYYTKDETILKKYIPDFFDSIVHQYYYAWLFQTWKESDLKSSCEKYNTKNLNLIFRSRLDYAKEKKEIEKEEAEKNIRKF